MGERDDRPLVGVGGWLIVFLIGLAVLSPIVVVAALVGLYADPQIALTYGDGWPLLEKIEWLLTGLQLALLWFMAWRLIRVRVWRSVRIVMVGIWIAAMGLPLLEIVAVSMVSGIRFVDILGPLLPGFGRSLVYCTVWTAYFLSSKRVANTYRLADEPAMAEVFS